MPKSSNSRQFFSRCDRTIQLLDEIVMKNFNEWSVNMDAQFVKKLEQCLFLRLKDVPAKLDINFDTWGFTNMTSEPPCTLCLVCADELDAFAFQRAVGPVL